MFPKETKVLIIDDMMTMRKLVKKSLVEIGFTNITEADDGETAWPIIEQAQQGGQAFQLIISDWNMPKMKGIDLLRKVRATEAIKKTPFVLLTAESESTQIKEAIAAGVTNYIIKPFTPTIIADKLKVVWNNLNKKAAA